MPSSGQLSTGCIGVGVNWRKQEARKPGVTDQGTLPFKSTAGVALETPAASKIAGPTSKAPKSADLGIPTYLSAWAKGELADPVIG